MEVLESLPEGKYVFGGIQAAWLIWDARVVGWEDNKFGRSKRELRRFKFLVVADLRSEERRTILFLLLSWYMHN